MFIMVRIKKSNFMKHITVLQFDKFYDKNILNEILLHEDKMREEKIQEIFCFHPVSKNKQFSVLVSPVKIAHEWGSVSRNFLEKYLPY